MINPPFNIFYRKKNEENIMDITADVFRNGPHIIKLYDDSSDEDLLFVANEYGFGEPTCELINTNEEIIFYGGLLTYKDSCKYIDASIDERILVLNFLNNFYENRNNSLAR